MLGKDSDACDQWLADALHALRHERYDPFFQNLVELRTGLRGHKQEVPDKLLKYVATRAEMILYKQCERRGWDVGGGPMESMCGVTTERIKGRGRRRDIDNAEATMALEGLYQSTELWYRHWANALAQLNWQARRKSGTPGGAESQKTAFAASVAVSWPTPAEGGH